MTAVQGTENPAKTRATSVSALGLPTGAGGPKLLDQLRQILRLMDCLHLRVQVIDFSWGDILVRDGKGAQDRITMLPEALKRVGWAIAHQSLRRLYRVVVMGGIPCHSKWWAIAHPTSLNNRNQK